MKTAFENRREALITWMQKKEIFLVIFEDTERRRSPAVRYFSGHPSDAILAIRIDGASYLSPWDENLAKNMAHVDKIIPFTKYDRNAIKAVAGLAEALHFYRDCKIEIPPSTPYPVFLQYVDALSQCDILCRENMTHAFADSLRSIKDVDEIIQLRKAAQITDELIELIEKKIIDNSIKSESDVALLIEKECRLAGCERTSFETLAAGSERSFGIHCFPSYTANSFGTDGLSILDFGVVYEGYGSDVTLTIARNISPEQEAQLSLVESAYHAALDLYKAASPITSAAEKVDMLFAQQKKTMPHSLGHGIGLEAHEYPFIRSQLTKEAVFKSGMVVTLEPGLYDLALGGVRLENDILITETGNEVLTSAHIIRL